MTTTREIPNQLIVPTELTERDLFLWLLDSLGKAKDCSRGLAQSRKDIRWLQVASLLERTRENVIKLKDKGSAPSIIQFGR